MVTKAVVLISISFCVSQKVVQVWNNMLVSK